MLDNEIIYNVLSGTPVWIKDAFNLKFDARAINRFGKFERAVDKMLLEDVYKFIIIREYIDATTLVYQWKDYSEEQLVSENMTAPIGTIGVSVLLLHLADGSGWALPFKVWKIDAKTIMLEPTKTFRLNEFDYSGAITFARELIK